MASTYILLTKCGGHTGRILALDLRNMDQVQQDPYKKKKTLRADIQLDKI